MKCPVCKDVLLLMTEKKGVEIDYCPQCRGIWLDKGELEKLVEAEKSYNQINFNNNYDEDKKNNNSSNHKHSHQDDDDDYNYKKGNKHSKTKGFLDMFDF